MEILREKLKRWGKFIFGWNTEITQSYCFHFSSILPIYGGKELLSKYKNMAATIPGITSSERADYRQLSKCNDRVSKLAEIMFTMRKLTTHTRAGAGAHTHTHPHPRHKQTHTRAHVHTDFWPSFLCSFAYHSLNQSLAIEFLITHAYEHCVNVRPL